MRSGRGDPVVASGGRRAGVVNCARFEVVICAVWCSARRWGGIGRVVSVCCEVHLILGVYQEICFGSHSGESVPTSLERLFTYLV